LQREKKFIFWGGWDVGWEERGWRRRRGDNSSYGTLKKSLPPDRSAGVIMSPPTLQIPQPPSLQPTPSSLSRLQIPI